MCANGLSKCSKTFEVIMTSYFLFSLVVKLMFGYLSLAFFIAKDDMSIPVMQAFVNFSTRSFVPSPSAHPTSAIVQLDILLISFMISFDRS